MSVLSAIQSAAPWIGISVPSAVFAGSDRTSVELQAVVKEAAQGIAEDFDWQRLKTVATITGDGSDTDFALPSDYARMLKKAQLFPSAQPNSPLIHVVDSDEWLQLEVENFGDTIGRWTIFANQINIKPAVALAATVKYFYISNKLVALESATTLTKATFTLDTDEFFLGDRILTLALIWRWKAAKGRAYAEDFQNYQNTRDILAGNDKGARIIHMGRGRVPRDVTIAYPGTLGP